MNEVYSNRDKSVEPRRIYFYRVVGNDIIEYFTQRRHNVPWTAVPREIEEIASEIASGTLQPTGTRPRQRIWRKRNYFIVYFESPNQKLVKDNAVVFSPSSHPFADGKDIPKENDVSIFYCINHFKGSQNEPDATFGFTINHHHDREDDNGRGIQPPITHNDTGTNTGPP